MADTCETVRVLHENPDYAGEFVEINATDYDPEKHTLYSPRGEDAPATKPAKSKAKE